MNILIVGGLGYLGPVVAKTIRHLLDPIKLDVFDTGWFLKSSIIDGTTDYDEVFTVDKRDITKDLLSPYDVVIDFAAVSNDPMGKDFENATMAINAYATIKLAEACKSAGVKRFVFASSCSIYGAAGDVARTEMDEKDPLTAYAKSKWQAEQMLAPLTDANFSAIALRFATACGWSPHFRSDLVLNDFVLTALTEGAIKVLSDGTPWRPLIHVKDIGRAVAWACQSQLTHFHMYNVGSNHWTLTIGELAANVSELLNVPYEIINENGPDKRSYKVAFDKFEHDARGWLPQENLQTAVSEIKQQLQPFIENYTDSRASNLIRLNVLREMKEGNVIDGELRIIGDII